jgi:hypothetical protein
MHSDEFSPIHGARVHQLLANSSNDACFCLIVRIVGNWIQDMAMIFPKSATRVSNAQLEFERSKESKMHVFVTNFMKEYSSTSLPPTYISTITFGRLGASLYLVHFCDWMQYATM